MTKKEFRQLCKAAWEKQPGFVVIDLSSKKTVNIEVGLTSFTYQIKLKTKLILFSHYTMEKLLKQIVNNTEPKRSFSIVISNNQTRSKTWFKPPIQLDEKKDYEIAFIDLERYYSFPNTYNSNDYFSYLPGACVDVEKAWMSVAGEIHRERSANVRTLAPPRSKDVPLRMTDLWGVAVRLHKGATVAELEPVDVVETDTLPTKE